MMGKMQALPTPPVTDDGTGLGWLGWTGLGGMDTVRVASRCGAVGLGGVMQSHITLRTCTCNWRLLARPPLI